MRIGLFTDSLPSLSLDEVLDEAQRLGVRDLEIGTGNYSPAPHCDLQAILHDRGARAAWLGGFERRGLSLCALNCSGNPLHPDPARAQAHDSVLRDTLRLAGELGIARIVTMSGCPGAPGGGRPRTGRLGPGCRTTRRSPRGSGRSTSSPIGTR